MPEKADEPYWRKKLQSYAGEPWAQQPTLFAQSILQYLPKSGTLLELGAGLGPDGLWFASHGLAVTQTDFFMTEMVPVDAGLQVRRQVVDLNDPLPFEPETFDVVYAHLSLHYFDKQRTTALFDEIYTILKPGGTFAMMVNSIHDPEVGEGKKLEENFYEVYGMRKRFFDPEFTTELTKHYETVVLDDHGTSRKDAVKGVGRLIQFVGRKP